MPRLKHDRRDQYELRSLRKKAQNKIKRTNLEKVGVETDKQVTLTGPVTTEGLLTQDSNLHTQTDKPKGTGNQVKSGINAICYNSHKNEQPKKLKQLDMKSAAPQIEWEKLSIDDDSVNQMQKLIYGRSVVMK